MADPARPQLTEEELEYERQLAAVRANLLYPYIASIIIGNPPGTVGASVNTASGVLLRIGSGVALATAEHVLDEYEQRLGQPNLAFQVGKRCLNLDNRSIWRHSKDDLALIALSEREAEDVGSLVHVPWEWPPPIPPSESLAIVTGFPIDARTQPSEHEVYFGPMVAQVPVLGAFENHFTCRLERDRLVTTFGKGLPDSSIDFGGMSGGPVFVEANWGYPLVGFVKEVKDDLEYFVVQGFGNAPDKL